MVKHIHDLGRNQSSVEPQILDGAVTLLSMSARGCLKERWRLQVVLVDVPLGSVPIRNVWVGVCSQSESRRFSSIFREITTEYSGGRGIEAGSSKDRGRLTSITDDFRVIIKRDGVINKVGAGITRDQSCELAWRTLDTPLREVHRGGRSSRTSAALATTGASGHSTTRFRGFNFIRYRRDDKKRNPYMMALVSSVTPSPTAP